MQVGLFEEQADAIVNDSPHGSDLGLPNLYEFSTPKLQTDHESWAGKVTLIDFNVNLSDVSGSTDV